MQVAVHDPQPYNKPVMGKARTKVRSETFRLTETASKLLQACADTAGISKAAVLEQAIRDYARKSKVTLPAQEAPEVVAPAVLPES